MSMALVMSQMPDVWRKVLAEHVPDQSQRCRECRDAGGHGSWPCQTYRIAQEAKWVAEGNLPGTGPHGPGPKASPRLSPPSRPFPVATDALGAGRDPLGPSSGSFSRPGPASDGFGSEFDRPFAGDPLGEMSPSDSYGGAFPDAFPDAFPAETGERPYGSTFDAPYGASFGVDDRPHARH